MGFFDWLKNLFIGNKNETGNKTGVITFPQVYTNVDFSKVNSYTYQSVADGLSRHAAKMKYRVQNPKTAISHYKYLDRILNFRPNTLQTAYSMWKSFFYDYYFSGIGLIYIEWDYSKVPLRVKNFWPISPIDIKSTKIYKNELYLEFKLNGNVIVDNADTFIILVRKPTSEDMLNVSDPSLRAVLEILATNDEGTIKAINNSNAIRFLASTPAKLNDKMKEDNQKKFDKRIAEASQVLYIDGAEHVVQVNSQGKYVDTTGVDSYRKEVFRSFGVNDKFIDSTFNENEWQAIHEGVFEPLQIALEQELTNKLFSQTEFDYGNRIETVVDRLQTASLSTRIKLAEIYEKLPVVVPNVVCDLLYLPKMEDGDKAYQTLNFVNSKDAASYQGVNDTPKEDEPKEDDENA